MNTDNYSVKWIKNKHKFIRYNEDGYEMLHLTKKFGFTDFSKKVDETNCLLTCNLMWTDPDGQRTKVSHSNKSKFIGRELIIYNDDNSIAYDDWVYMDVTKTYDNLYDINGNLLKFGG